jgi:hypothetical protein
VGFETRRLIDPIIPVEGWQAAYEEFLEKASGFKPKSITLGVLWQIRLALKISSQKCGLQPMSWQPSGKLVTDMGFYLPLP